jgi:anthranilate/para-aminobenzoate synthase component II
MNNPKLRIGILNLHITTNLANRLASKFQSSENFEDFDINENDITEPPKNEQELLDLKKSIIKKYMETPNKLKQIPTSYFKQFISYENVILIPIDIDLEDHKLDYLVENLDAIFFTGGPNSMYQKNLIQVDEVDKKGKDHKYNIKLPSQYLSKAKRIIMKVAQLNNEGRDMVIWGTCLGFEALIEHESTISFKFDEFNDIKKAHAIKIVDKIQEEIPNPEFGIEEEYIGPENSYVDSRRRVELTREVSTQVISKDQNQNDLVVIKTQKDKMVIADSNLSIDNWSEYFHSELGIENSIQDMTYFEEYPDDFNVFVNKNFMNHQDDKVFYFYHSYGVTPRNLLNDDGLRENYDIITISDQNDFKDESANLDSDSIDLESIENPNTFVSSIQHKKYPFYGVQFHPEKMEFESNKNNSGLVHTPLAIEQNRKLMDYFVYRVLRSKFRNLDKKILLKEISSEYLAKMKFKVRDLNGYDEIIFF